MIAAIGNSEYLSRRVAPVLRALDRSDRPLLVGTDHPRGPRPDPTAETVVFAERRAVLANPAVETVYISSATGRHFADCHAALTAGKHVLVEKPICLRADQVRDLDRLARERRLTVFECLSYPHHPAWEDFAARAFVGPWADRVVVTATFRIPRRDQSDFRRRPGHGGAAADLGTYCVDALVRLGASVHDLDIRSVALAHSDLDGGVAIASRAVDGQMFAYTGSWAIGDGYANGIVVADTHRRLELFRAFSPPVEAGAETTSATAACVAAGIAHVREPGTTGVVGCSALLDRVAALEQIATSDSAHSST